MTWRRTRTTGTKRRTTPTKSGMSIDRSGPR
jgi:hypothetical protein